MNRAAAFVAMLALAASPCDGREIQENRVARVKVKFETVTDRFNGNTVVVPKKLLNARGTAMLTALTFNPGISHPEGGAPQAFAMVRYRGQGWIFLTNRLEMLVDGIRLQIEGETLDNLRDVTLCSVPDCIVEEYARFPLSHATLQALASAKHAEIRVNGRRGSMEGTLTEDHVAYARAVLERLPAEPTGAGHAPEARQHHPATGPAWAPSRTTQDPSKRVP